MLRNIIGPVLTLKIVFFVEFALFFKNPLLCAGRLRFSNIKKKKQKMDQFLTLKRANIGPFFNFIAHIYIYIFILES